MKKLFDFRLNSRYLSFLLKHELKFMVVLFLAYFIVFPFQTYLALPNFKYYDSAQNFLTGQFSLPIVLFILSCVFLPGILMSFIMNRSKMDTYQSLPIRKQDLFFNHFVQICIVVLLPLLLNWLLTLLIFGIGVSDLLNQNILHWLLNALKVVAFTPILVGVSLFAFVNSGRLFDGILYSIVLHLSQYFGLYLVTDLFMQRLIGLGNTLTQHTTSLFSYMNAMFAWIFDQSFTPFTIMWIVVGIVLYFINKWLYANRKVENIDDSAVNNWFIPFVINFSFVLLVAFMLLLFMNNNTYLSSIVFPLFLGLILYLVSDAIINRGFQKVFNAIPRYFIVGLISLVIVYSTVMTGFFGETKKVPQLNEFDTVLMTVVRYDRENVEDTRDYSDIITGAKTINDVINKSNNLSYGFHNTQVFTEPQERQNVLDFHNNYLEAYYATLEESGTEPKQYGNSWSYGQDPIYLYYNGSSATIYLTYVKDKKIIMRRQYYTDPATFEKFYQGN